MKNILFVIFVIISFTLVNGELNKRDFDVSAPIIKSVLKDGESVINPINIINYERKQRFNISHYSDGNFVSIENDDFVLDANRGGTFNVIFNSNYYGPGIYVGEVFVLGEKNSISIPFIFEVETHSVNFDVSAEMAPGLANIAPGNDFIADVTIYNFGSEDGDGSLHYMISDLKGRIIISEFQNFSIGNKLQITKTFPIPEDIAPGDYVFSVSASDKNLNSVGTSSLLFNISKEIATSPETKDFFNYYLNFALGIIFILIVAFLVINYYWNKKLIVTSRQWRKKLIDVKKIKGDVSKKISKLEYSRSLLEGAYNKGYIKKRSYNEGKQEINSFIHKLKKRL